MCCELFSTNEGSLDFTFSSDGTTYRHQNYESRTVAVETPDYTNPAAPKKIALRTLGVGASIDHTSETQVNGLKRRLQVAIDIFKGSPLAQRLNIDFELNDFAAKLRGMNGDHAADQKKDYTIVKAWKEDVRDERLGTKKLGQLPLPELVALLGAVKGAYIDELGGALVWMKFSEQEHKIHEAAILRTLCLQLGKEEYVHLSDEEKRTFDLFIWAGCCMHKDMNAFKGGDKALGESWDLARRTRPATLANNDNAAVLARVGVGGPSTAAEVRAEEVSGRGGVKATTLGGMICNNKDNKKGQQDTYRWYFAKVLGYPASYPDVSNTRYQTHGNAAAEIITHLSTYISFMEYVRDKKQKPGFTNVEKNFFTALHDIPTLTEFAVMALYSQAITIPYMRTVRGKGTNEINILDLGEYHDTVKNHVKKIIRDPGLLIAENPDETYKLGTLDGLEWSRREAVEAVYKLAPTLPHLQPALVAFFEGAAVTWERFTSEFADIAGLTAGERRAAFMPATNDVNEGALGTYTGWCKDHPSGTRHQFEARLMHDQNHTKEYMESENFRDEDHAYCRKVAREVLASLPQVQAQVEQISADEADVKKKREKMEELRRKKYAHAERIAAIVLELDKDIVRVCNVKFLDDQLELHRTWDKDVPIKARVKVRSLKLKALLEAIDRYVEDRMEPPVQASSDSTTSVAKPPNLDDPEYDSDYHDDHA